MGDGSLMTPILIFLFCVKPCLLIGSIPAAFLTRWSLREMGPAPERAVRSLLSVLLAYAGFKLIAL